MKCNSCGTLVKSGDKFCPNCGGTIEVKEKEVKNNNNFGDLFISVIKYILSVLLKPIDAIKEYKDKMVNPIFAVIISGIISLVMVISNLIFEIFDVISVSHYTFGKGYETSIEFSRIKDLNFLELIFKNFFIYVLIILVIAGVFYLSSLVIKKEINFFKSVTISASSLLPFVLCSFILAPIMTIAWEHFTVINLLGIVYSVSLLLGLYNYELRMDGNMKIYYNSINIGILIVISYVVFVSLFKNTVFGL